MLAWRPTESPQVFGSLVVTASSFRRLVGSLAVDQPRYAEAINEHAKSGCPERFLEGHHNPAALGQLVKDTLGVSRALDMKRERETFWLLILIRHYVSSHQHLAADCDAAVHNLVPPVSRHLIRQGRPGVTEDRPELSTETLFIELERCLALSLEAQIWVHLHWYTSYR